MAAVDGVAREMVLSLLHDQAGVRSWLSGRMTATFV